MHNTIGVCTDTHTKTDSSSLQQQIHSHKEYLVNTITHPAILDRARKRHNMLKYQTCTQDQQQFCSQRNILLCGTLSDAPNYTQIDRERERENTCEHKCPACHGLSHFGEDIGLELATGECDPCFGPGVRLACEQLA